MGTSRRAGEITAVPMRASQEDICLLVSYSNLIQFQKKALSESCAAAGSLRFQLRNLANPSLPDSNKKHFQSLLIFQGFHNQSASVMDEETGRTGEVKL